MTHTNMNQVQPIDDKMFSQTHSIQKVFWNIHVRIVKNVICLGQATRDHATLARAGRVRTLSSKKKEKKKILLLNTNFHIPGVEVDTCLFFSNLFKTHILFNIFVSQNLQRAFYRNHVHIRNSLISEPRALYLFLFSPSPLHGLSLLSITANHTHCFRSCDTTTTLPFVCVIASKKGILV